MRVDLLTNFDFLKVMEYNAAYAMLICHANTDRLQEERAENFIRKAISMHHDSILEHITLTYAVYGLSRACLQELARHRHISLSVESTRHTLKKFLLDEKKCASLSTESANIIPLKYIICISDIVKGLGIEVKNKEKLFVAYEQLYLSLLRYTATKTKMFIGKEKKEISISNDELKYFIPEFWPTNLVLTANVRELRHIVRLRTAPAALNEFQHLACEFVNVLPERFKYLLEDCVYVDKK